MRNRRGMIGLALLTVALVGAGSAWGGAVEGAVRRLIASADLRDTQVGVCVYDLQAGEYLVEIGADESMIPASNAKLLTSAAALDLLGPDFAFATTLGVAGEQPGGSPVLTIDADGDPAFGDPDLLERHGFGVEDLVQQWLQAIVATGHKRFEQLIIDDRVFDQNFVHPTWEADDLPRAYGAQVAGLNFYNNCVDVLAIPGRPGEAPVIRLYPDASFIARSNKARTGNNDGLIVHRIPGSNQLMFSGSVKSQPASPMRLSIHDPSMFFAQYLVEQLAAQGVSVGAIRRAQEQETLPPARALHVVRTTLPLVLQRTNQDSENTFAAALLKRAGHAYTGMPGSWDNGAAAVREALSRRLGPGSAVARDVDGSGLSRENRVSARLLTDLLASMHRDPAVSAIFRESLAYAGRTPEGQYLAVGTLKPRSRFDDLEPGNWVFGKTGYIRGVCSLSGYLIIADEPGHPPRVLAFAILLNNFKPPKYLHHMQAVQGKIVKTIEQSISQPVHLGG